MASEAKESVVVQEEKVENVIDEWRECGPEDKEKSGGVSDVVDGWRECGPEVVQEAVPEETVSEIVDEWRECGPEGKEGEASDILNQWRDCSGDA